MRSAIAISEESQPGPIEISSKQQHESEAAASDADTSQVSVSSLPEDEGTASSGLQHLQGKWRRLVTTGQACPAMRRWSLLTARKPVARRLAIGRTRVGPTAGYGADALYGWRNSWNMVSPQEGGDFRSGTEYAFAEDGRCLTGRMAWLVCPNRTLLKPLLAHCRVYVCVKRIVSLWLCALSILPYRPSCSCRHAFPDRSCLELCKPGRSLSI